MYEAKVTLYFSAAHFLDGYPGNCARIHGHNWRITAAVRAEELDKLGFVADFREIKKNLKEITDELDHTMLNDHPHFKKLNPSSENVAAWIFGRLKVKTDDDRCRLHFIEVAETQDCSIRYYG
jgi:6-pyruvoyltetrahydropterin/6-carboxytetrahydropterin synthase